MKGVIAMANLFPTDNMVLPLDNVRPNNPVGYKQSIDFDDDLGDLARDGTFKVKTASGIEAYKQWCINCMQTERFALSSYSSDFGINTRPVRNLPDRSSKEIYLKNEITNALMADDYKRTKSVSDFVFDWFAPDAVRITVTVVGVDNAKIDISTTISPQR